MTPNGPTDDLAARLAAGALTPDEVAAAEALLAAGDPGAVAFARAVEELAAAVPPVVPPPDLKARLLAALPPPPAVPGFVFRFAADGGFEPTPHPGVWCRVLHVDPARRQFTALMRLDPGAVYPCHPHDGPEECVVLEGEIEVGGVRLRKGDYQRAEPGSTHVDQSSPTGALLFLTAPASLLGG
jgi:hypothetical protein